MFLFPFNSFYYSYFFASKLVTGHQSKVDKLRCYYFNLLVRGRQMFRALMNVGKVASGKHRVVRRPAAMLVYTCGNVALKTGLFTSLSGYEAPSKSRCVWVSCFSFHHGAQKWLPCLRCSLPRGKAQQESDVGGNVTEFGRA